MTIQLWNDRYIDLHFEGLKNDEKNICWRIRFSAIAHLQKATITASLEICPILDVPLMGDNMIIFVKKKRIKCSYSKIYTYLTLYN